MKLATCNWRTFQKRQMAMEKNSNINILSSILAVGAIASGAYNAGSVF